MAPERLSLRCAAEASARREPLFATASRVRRWLLLEQPGPWGRKAPVDSRLDAGVAHRLREEADRAGVRVVLLRRAAGSDGDRGRPRRVYLVRTGARHRWIEQLDVDDPATLPDLELGALAEDDPPGLGRPGPAAVHLVCTNGKHDPCCADLGRPVVRALRAAAVPEVWESTHIGGDRFAANVVILPTGVYYGRVPSERARQLVEDHAAGLLDLDHYRGRCCHPPIVQAAEIFLRRELGERRLDALVVGDATPVASHRRAVVVDHVDAGSFVVTVDRRRGDPLQLTCLADDQVAPWSFELVDLRRA